MRLVLIVPIVLLLSVIGCQTKPTRLHERQERDFATLVQKSKKPIVLTENTVVLDARGAFDYGLNHVEGSLHLPWESLAENVDSGEILRDRRRLAQRLALLGLKPDTPIVIVGYGPRGEGQEGRLAWSLLYLGFRDVQTANLEIFRKHWTNKPTEQPKNADPIELETQVALVTPVEEFRRWANNPKGRTEARVHIIDVRSEKEYFNRNPSQAAKPDISALHIEWKEFFGTDGRASSNLQKRLKQMGMGENDRIILISNRGVRSAAAAYALMSLGFRRVENFLPGWRAI